MKPESKPIYITIINKLNVRLLLLLLAYSVSNFTVCSDSCIGGPWISKWISFRCKALINKSEKVKFQSLVNVRHNYSEDEFCKIARILLKQMAGILSDGGCGGRNGSRYIIKPRILAESYVSSLGLLYQILKNDYKERRKALKPKTGHLTNNTETNISTTPSKLEDHDRDQNIKDIINSETEYILGMVGNCTSIISLFGVLLRYILFKELRTKAGTNMIVLSVLMLLTCLLQILYLKFNKIKITCIVIAIILQWAYLNVFLLTLVIAIDLYKTFGKRHLILPSNDNNKHSYYAWFLCLLLSSIDVGICVALRFAAIGIDIVFAGNGRCFISGLYANLFAFVIPVFGIVFTNASLLAVISYRLNQDIQSRNAIRQYGFFNHHFTVMKTVVKISTLLSLPWLFAILAGITRNAVLLYIFWVLHSFQGVFIFIAFCCNKRIWNLYKRKAGTLTQKETTAITTKRNRTENEARYILMQENADLEY